MVPVTGGANRKWGFTGKVETRSYERLVDALIDFVETGDGLKERFLAGFAACLAADRKSVENRGFGVADSGQAVPSGRGRHSQGIFRRDDARTSVHGR